MAEFEQQEIPFKERRLRSTKLRRGIFLLPSMFTVANLLCGYYAVVASFVGGPEEFDRAAKAIGFAILFDSLDGRVARMTGTTSEFGVQFDSLADVVSFGVAPALIAYAWGVRSLPGQDTLAVEQISQVGWICCLLFLICCAWRLARFNVQGMAPGSSKNFVGLPRPPPPALSPPSCTVENSAARRALGDGLALRRRRPRRAHDQHRSLLQLQGRPLDPPPAFSRHRSLVPVRRRRLEILRGRSDSLRFLLRRGRPRCATYSRPSPPRRFTDRVIQCPFSGTPNES